MRVILLFVASCLLANSQDLVIGWVSDHGTCVPHGLGFVTPTNLGQRIAASGLSGDCRRQMDVQAMINSWNVDLMISTGDLSNVRGNRSETYKGILVRTVTPITCAGATIATLQETVAAGSAVSQTVDVSAAVAGGSGTVPVEYVINCGQTNAEVIRVTSNDTTSTFTASAVFYKPHAIGEPIINNSQTVTIDTTESVACGFVDCLTNLLLTGATETFTSGSNLTQVDCAAGTCTATITTSEKARKAGDEVVITGEEDLEGTFTISGATATTFAWPSIASGTYTTGITLVTQRLLFVGTYLGLDEENVDVFELPRVTASTKTTFTAQFAQPHDAGVILRGSDHITILPYVRQGLFLPVMGNHDHGGGDQDWCTGCTGNNSEAFNQYWSSSEAGSWPVSTNNYHTKVYAPLVTFFATATSGSQTPVVGNTQATYFTDQMTNCATQWCATLTHYPLYTDSRHGALNSLGSCVASVCQDPNPNYGWLAGPNVDIVLSGHIQYPEHNRAPNDSGSVADLDYAIMSTSGDSVVTGATADGGNAADLGFTTVWGATVAGGSVTSTYMAGKITINDTTFKIEYFAYTDWITPVHTIELTKSASTNLCTGAPGLCIVGGTIQ